MPVRLLTAAGIAFVGLCVGCTPAAGQGAAESSLTDPAERAEQLAAVTLKLSRIDRAEHARRAFEAPGIVLSTPRLNVAGDDAELVERIASMVEEAVVVLPPELVDADLRIRVNIERPAAGRCPARAWASAWEGYGTIEVFVDSAWSEATLRRIVAHEVGHVYHLVARGEIPGPQGDALLVEGLATWLAREAWLADLGFASLDDAVRQYQEAGTYMSLAGAYEVDIAAVAASAAECLALRDRLYTQWAAFVTYLLDGFGLEAVMAATAQPREVLGERVGMLTLAPLDYEAAFGVALAELEREWLDDLDGQ